jgi:hypothetical protein
MQLIAAKQTPSKALGVVEDDGDEALPEGELDDDFELVNELEVASDHPSPPTMLPRGHSDHFQTFAIPIDAMVPHAMRDNKELYFPGVCTDANNSQVRNATGRDFAEIVSFNADESTAYAFLARIVAATRKSKSRTSVIGESLIFRIKGIAAPRKRLLDKKAM